MDDLRAGRLLPGVPFFIVFVISVVCFLYVYGGNQFYQHRYQRRFIVLAGLFVLCFLCFSTMNYYTSRYLLAVIVPMLFLVAVFSDMLISRLHKWLYSPVLTIMLLISFFSFRYDNDLGDANQGAFAAMEVEEDVVTFFERQGDFDKSISGYFLQQQHLKDPATGFLHSERLFKNVKWEIDKATDYVIFDNIEPDARYKEIKQDTGFQLVYRAEKGKSWAEIYAKR